MTIDTLFQEFIDRPILTASTRRKYFYRMRGFIAAHSGKQANEITEFDVAIFFQSKPHLADPSRALLRACFLAFFNFCIAQGACESNPAASLEKWRAYPLRIRLPLETAVIAALDEAVAMNNGRHPHFIRDGLIFALAVVSGNRRGELRNLPLDDLLASLESPELLEDGTLVYRVYTTGKTGEAICRFTDFHTPMIDNYLAVRPDVGSAYVFVNLNPSHERYGRKLSLVAINRVRERVCRRAGVGSITYQELRRRLATKIARAESVDVAAHALNHSKHSGDRVIREYYYDPDKAAVDAATARAFLYQ